MAWLTQSKDLKLSPWRRIVILVLGFLDNILFGGAVFGWPQLVYVLKVDGIYGDLCPDGELGAFNNEDSDNGFSSYKIQCPDIISQANLTSAMQERNTCPAQDDKFAMIYTLAVVCYGVPGVIVGFLLHHVGLRLTKMLGSFMIALSFVFLGLASPESPAWLFPATVLLSIGGNQVRMSSMQFGDLFPRRRSTTITVLSGVYAASASLFVVFAIAQDYGVSRSTVCFCLAGLGFFLMLLSLVLPLRHIPYEDERETNGMEKNIIVQDVTLMESLKSASSLLHLYWFFITLFCINLFQQFYNVWITNSSCTQEEENKYSLYFSYSNLISVFCAPLGGLFTDHLVQRARKNQSDQLMFRTREIQANFIPLFVTTLFVIALHGCQFFFNGYAIVTSLVCLIVVRPCIVAISTAYLRIRFPADHFNRLIGIYCTISSCLMYFQYPVFKWAQNSFYAAQGVTWALIILSVLNPLHLLFTKNVKQNVKDRDRFFHDYENEKLTKA